MIAPTTHALAGWRVLVPRDGDWGNETANLIRAHGGTPVIAPLIRTEPLTDDPSVTAALARLIAGDYDWLVVTSAAAAPLFAGLVSLPDRTRIATVGPSTTRAVRSIGLDVDLSPDQDFSARGLIECWPSAAAPGRVLMLRSDLADATLPDALRACGADVDAIVGYRTVPVTPDPALLADLAVPAAIALATSGSVVRQLVALGPRAPRTVVCIGPITAARAHEAGLVVAATAHEQSVPALIDALVAFARESAPPTPSETP